MYEGWFLLRDPDRLQLLQEVSAFDAEFGSAMFNVLCLRGNPELDELD